MNFNDVKAIHPDIEPVVKAPSTGGLWGIGARLLGKREYCEKTNSFVILHYFTFLFIPCFPLGAYRVIQDGKTYYFLGQLRVPARDKKLGALVTSLLLGTIGAWAGYQYTTTPGYVAKRHLATAQELVQQGQFREAVKQYQEVYPQAPAEFSNAAQSELRSLLAPDSIRTMPMTELAGTITAVRQTPGIVQVSKTDALLSAVTARINAEHDNDPANAHAALHSVIDLNPEHSALKVLDDVLLKNMLAKKIQEVETASELAVKWEPQRDINALKALLQPLEDKLGSTEGARILGQIYVAEENFQKAYGLLSVYIGDRLQQLNAAEKNYYDVQQKRWDAEFDFLNKGHGPQSFYDEYKATAKEQQRAFVEQYVAEKLRNDGKIKIALDAYRQAATVVPAALDLGVAQLRRAETFTDQSQRQAELQAAEKTFLSIRGIAGDQDQYRLYLGQVYYWLGKHDEGHKEFEAILEKYQRSSDVALSVAMILRDLGISSEAETLAKAAYESAKDDPQRYAAAQAVVLLARESKDRLFWLERCDPESASVQMELLSEKARLAERNGDTNKAINYYRQAVTRGESLPISTSTYNNTALIDLALFRLTGDNAVLSAGLDKMEKAIALAPSDSILLSNTSHTMLRAALRNIIGNQIDFTALQMEPQFSSLRYLYVNDQGFQHYKQQLLSNELIGRATGYLKKAILLAPKEVRNYLALFEAAAFMEDKETLIYLNQKLEQNHIDLTYEKQMHDKYVRGEDQEQNIEQLQNSIKLYQRLLASLPATGITRSVALDSLAEIKLALIQQGKASDIDDVINDVMNAQRAHDSAAIQKSLVSVYLTKASLDLARQSDRYKAVRTAGARQLGESLLAALTVLNHQDDGRALLQMTATQRALELMRKNMQAFPDSDNEESWALLKHSDPEIAARIADNIQHNPLSALSMSVSRQLYGYNASVAAMNWLYLQASDKKAESEKMIREFQANDVYIPSMIALEATGTI